MLPDSLRDVVPVPFPGFAVVRRKRLTPDWSIWVARVPPEHHDDRFTVECVFAEKVAHIVFKRTDHRRIEDTDIAGHPVQPAIMHLPFPDQKIEIARGRCRRRGNFQVAVGIEAQFWNRQIRISGQNCLLRLRLVNASAARTDAANGHRQNCY